MDDALALPACLPPVLMLYACLLSSCSMPASCPHAPYATKGSARGGDALGCSVAVGDMVGDMLGDMLGVSCVRLSSLGVGACSSWSQCFLLSPDVSCLSHLLASWRSSSLDVSCLRLPSHASRQASFRRPLIPYSDVMCCFAMEWLMQE